MRFLALGEAMVELSPNGETLYRRGFAGDTLNTAWYMRAALGQGVGFATVIGQDTLSAEMLGFLTQAGIDTSRIQTHPQRTLGLYMISLVDGERSFSYWRGQSAAKTLADDPAALAQMLSGVDMLYVSGITFAILSPEGRQNLMAALKTARHAGARVAFDPNLRPRLWMSDAEMTEVTMAAARVSDIVLPSFEDEAAYFGDTDLLATSARYLEAGAGEVAVKNGGQNMFAQTANDKVIYEAQAPFKPVDTTGAGDSFNGGYLSARLNGASVEEALSAGEKIARRVIMHPGALLPISEL